MRILSVALKNFKSHVDRCFNFEAGTNAICGENGAGKTSILEAIGWVLFDFSDYTREEIIRAGCKEAEAAVTFISFLDSRSYQVRRSTQRGYSLYDPQLNQKLEYELRADVLQWLRQHLGVPKGTDLSKLFSSTIGVPQGMLTADFLLKPKDRKTIFDRILKVEEYQQVAKDLLKLENYSKEQISQIKYQIELLNVQLQDWDPLTEQKTELMHQIQYAQKELTQLRSQRQDLKTQIEQLDVQAQTLSQLEQDLTTLSQAGSVLQIQFQQLERALAEADAARIQSQHNQAGYEGYLQALETLKTLEGQQQHRQDLLKQQQTLQTQGQSLETQRIQIREQLKQFDKIAQQLQSLGSQIEVQSHLEHRIQTLDAIRQTIQQQQHAHQLLRSEWDAQNQQLNRCRQDFQKAELAQQQCQIWNASFQAFRTAESQLHTLELALQDRQKLIKQRDQRIQHYHSLEIRQSRLAEQRSRFEQLKAEIGSLQSAILQQQALEADQKTLQNQAQQFQLWHQQQTHLESDLSRLETQIQQLHQQIQARHKYQPQVDQIPQLEQEIQILTTQLSRIDAAQQYQTELQQTLHQSHQSFTHQSQQVQQALQIIDQLSREFPQMQAPLHRIPPVLTQGSALTQQILQTLEEILIDISRQTSRQQIESQRQHLQSNLHTCYQLRAQVEQIPQLEKDKDVLAIQIKQITDQLETLAWNLESEQSTLRHLQEIQFQLQKLGDPLTQAHLKQRELDQQDPVEQEWGQLQEQLRICQDQITDFNQRLQPTEDIEQKIAAAQSQRQQHRQIHDQYLQTLPLAQQKSEFEQQLQSAQTQLSAIEAEGKKAQALLAALESQHGSLNQITQQLDQLIQELKQLGDPRFQASRLQQELTHRDRVEQQFETIGFQLADYQSQIQSLSQLLQATAQLDQKIVDVQHQRDNHQQAYETFLRCRELAEKVPDLQQKLSGIQTQIAENQQLTQQVQVQRDLGISGYDPEYHESLGSKCHQLEILIAQLQTQLQALDPQLNQVQIRLAHLTTLKEEQKVKAAQDRERDKLHRFIKFSRDVYKQAGPKITALYQSSVNVLADRLFREIMDRPNLNLTWGSDYDIWVQEDGMAPRRFISLSGGEQMAAALAVRLALLRTLGELDIAFFDEPTTNMDVQRRRRLAEAIMQIKTFEQLVVISHDDTFEQVTENIIRVEREEGSHVA